MNILLRRIVCNRNKPDLGVENTTVKCGVNQNGIWASQQFSKIIPYTPIQKPPGEMHFAVFTSVKATHVIKFKSRYTSLIMSFRIVYISGL